MSDDFTREQLLPLVGAVRAKGRWMMALCPLNCNDGASHPKKPLDGASLGIDEEGGLKCFAGCDTAELYRHFRAKLKETQPDSRWGRKQQPRPSGQHDGAWHVANREPDIAYGFRGTDGELEAVHGRWNFENAEGNPDKTFRWRLPDGPYAKGLGDGNQEALPLYGTHEMPADGAIAVVEGEKAAHACREAGLFAVCGPGGAGQREWGESLEVLRDRDVYLWPDNDKVGRDLMISLLAQLRRIAKHVIVLAPEASPKDDAHDYFVGNKRTLDDLLADVLLEPSVEVLAADHYRIRMPSVLGVLSFEFDGLTRSSRAIDCELTVRAESGEPTPYMRRINLLSDSALDRLTRGLPKQFGSERDTGANWTTIISQAIGLALSSFGEIDQTVQVAEVPNPGNMTWVVEQMVPEHQPTILFGDGESSKTWMALDMGLSVMWGSDWHGRPVKQGGVLLIDYEDSLIGFRLRRLLQGRDLDPAIMPDIPFFYRNAEGLPLFEMRDEIKRYCDANDIVLIIIDSGADACGGAPEQSDPTLQMFRSLSYIGRTSIIICHNRGQSADPNDKSHTMRPYGSRFWFNRARRVFYIASNADEAVSEYDVVFTARKATDGQKPPRIAMRMHFDDSDPDNPGPIEINETRARDVTGGTVELTRSNRDQIDIAIVARGGHATIAQIAEITQLSVGVIRTTLNRYDQTFVRVGTGGENGREHLWGLIAWGMKT